MMYLKQKFFVVKNVFYKLKIGCGGGIQIALGRQKPEFVSAYIGCICIIYVL